jgi:(1->4)-alpha-D-glucan 1-alpha-D-glucosylmutase
METLHYAMGAIESTLENYIERMQTYMVKAVREAKVVSSWIAPHREYEQALTAFIGSLLSDRPLSAFRTDFESYVHSWAQMGVWNSLSQTLLKICSPGVPDLYQGTELWDLHLVDPDNRRPVDFALRQRMLDDLLDRMSPPADRLELIQSLLANCSDGLIKFFVTLVALRARHADAELFTTSEYTPLTATGSLAAHVCAFARGCFSRSAIIVTPRVNAQLVLATGNAPVGRPLWGDTQISIPAALQRHDWQDAFSHQSIVLRDGRLRVGDALEHFPLALLMSQATP